MTGGNGRLGSARDVGAVVALMLPYSLILMVL